MATQEKRYTREDLLRLSDSGRRYELIHGELREITPVKNAHGILVLHLSYFLSQNVRQTKSGFLSTEVGFNLSEEDTVAPDIAFVAADRFDKTKWDDYFPGAPDLAVEVVSPSESASDIHEKVNLYLEYGTKLVWILYSKTRTVAVHTTAGSVTLKQGDILDGSDVLPGFKVTVKELFSVLDQ